MTVVVEGDVSAVTAAVENAVAGGLKKPVAHAVIASPHAETQRLMKISAARIQK